jgi:hypothetical protein
LRRGRPRVGEQRGGGPSAAPGRRLPAARVCGGAADRRFHAVEWREGRRGGRGGGQRGMDSPEVAERGWGGGREGGVSTRRDLEYFRLLGET